MKNFLTRAMLALSSAAAIIAASCSGDLASAQVINPSQPATGVPVAGTGISVAGQTVSVNYGLVANTALQGNALHAPTAIGDTTPNTAAFTALSATGAVSGAGFSSLFATPFAIGSTTPNTGAFTTLSTSALATLASSTVSGTTTNNGATVLTGTVSGVGIDAYIANHGVVQTLLNVAALRTTACVSGLVYMTQGYHTLGDGASGAYVCNGSDTTSTDNGGTIIAASNSSRYYLVTDGKGFRVRMFGAYGDNSHDDTTSIQAALSSVAFTTYQGSFAAMNAKGGGKIVFDTGYTYKITAPLLIGQNTTVEGAAPTAGTAPQVTTNTGAVISCNFGTQTNWCLSSATYTVPSGVLATYAQQYAGSDVDNSLVTLSSGIIIRGLTINGNGAYGGIRLLATSDFHVEDVTIYNTGVGLLLNAGYGGVVSKVRSLFDIYGLVVLQCNSINFDHFYAKKAYTGWAVSGTNQLLDLNNFGPGNVAFMPNWSGLHIGVYVQNTINMAMHVIVSETADVGFAIETSTQMLLDGYAEANTTSNFGFVTTAAQMTVFSNSVSGTAEYTFGVNNNINLVGCNPGRLYVGNAQNTINVNGSPTLNSPYTDWTWNDAVTFMQNGAPLNSFKVAAAGTTTAVYGNVNFDEALRRISVSKVHDWYVLINPGDTVTTASQLGFEDKNIVFNWQTSGTKPTIAAGPSGGGFIFRWTFGGNASLRFQNVNISFPTTPTGAAGDQALINTSESTTMELSVDNCIVNLGAAYSLLGTFSGAAINLTASFKNSGITSLSATNPNFILRNTGAALVTSIQAGTTVDANIKALGTNGWQGTVLSSNF